MRSRTKQMSQAGDTIIEVLISVAIVSSVLAGAFTVSQKSAIAVRDGQERGEMLQILQGQVELVRSLALEKSGGIPDVFVTAPKFFCIDESTRTKVGFDTAVNSLPPLKDDSFTTATYKDQCRNLGGRYNVAVTYDTAVNAFVFVGRWDGVGGQKNQQQLSYRINTLP